MSTEQKVTRKLRAILSADVKGYSLLMTNDEASTIKTLKEYRIIMSELVKQHSGRVVDAPGDNLLAEFASVVNAVQCSVEIQSALKVKNADLPDDKRLEFRIGVNIGDVVQDGDSLYGEGVNIAARIEGLADPGGVCISRNAYGHIRNKLNFGYEYLGDHSVKNIKHPVRVYKVLMESEDAGKLIGEEPKPLLKTLAWSAIIVASIILIGYLFFQKPAAPEFEPASIEKMALPLPEKPSIAVLPFDNMSGDPEQEYFSDGITDVLISSLAKIENLLVISKNSTFTYKGKHRNIQEIAKELNVGYVLEGSVQKAGNTIRIIAQLIDGKTDHHVWAETYDGDGAIDEVFKLQDQVTEKIVSALELKLSPREKEKLAEKGTQNLEAYDAYLRGVDHMRRFTPNDYAKAIEYFKQAVKLDSDYSQAHATLAYLYRKALYGGKKFWDAIGKGFITCRLLSLHHLELSMKKPTSKTYQVLAFHELSKRNFNKALDFAKKAVNISPSDSDALSAYGLVLLCCDNPEKAIIQHKKAIMLDPLHKSTGGIGVAYFFMGDYEQAVQYIEKELKDYPEKKALHGFLASSYAFLGNDIKAKKALDEYFS